jgi:hypothetical protein
VEDSVLKFLKAEYKMSDTGSPHRASSFVLSLMFVPRCLYFVTYHVVPVIPSPLMTGNLRSFCMPITLYESYKHGSS